MIMVILQGDPREPHINSSTPLPKDLLSSIGVFTSYYPPSDVAGVDELAKSRGYKNRDEITVSSEKMGAVYEDKIKMFFNEHLHEDEEIRWILDGAGYFDVRANTTAGEKWVRIKVEEGDLIVLPAGIYHRFTVDENNVSPLTDDSFF